VRGEGAALVDELSGLVERVVRRERLLGHRLDTRGAVGQGPAQRISRPRLTSPALIVSIALCCRHTSSLAEDADRAAFRMPVIAALRAADAIITYLQTHSTASASTMP
jgi:hypothetical protein